MWIYDPERKCRKCGCSEYPFYGTTRTKVFCIMSICMLCYREDNLLSYHKNKHKYTEREKQNHREYRLKNVEKYRELDRKRYWRNKKKRILSENIEENMCLLEGV